MPVQSLFHPRIINKALSSANILKAGKIPPKHQKILDAWHRSISDDLIKKQSEGDLHSQFYSLFCETILGYKSSINRNLKTKSWTLANEKAVKGTGRVDIGLGLFSDKKSKLIAPLELKSPKTHNLDVAMLGRKESTVEQAARYARNSEGQAEWFIVSNCLEIRLYKYPFSDSIYQCWQISDLVQAEKYAEFVLLMQEKNLLKGQTEKLFQASREIEKDITHALYADYREARIKLINGMKRENNRFRRASMVTRAQTLLDRVLFIAYAEDSELLPDRSLSHYIANKGMQTSWEALKLLFQHVDKGDKQRNIPRYNGDLFKPDADLEELELSDELISELQCLWEYDFSTDVSVTILGHIFEQSIADLDHIYDALDEGNELILTQQKVGTSGKRKQEGVVYTPDFITQWIVKTTLDSYLSKKQAGIDHPAESVEWWSAYRNVLATLRILDPACGSGAFLVAAYQYLKKEYALVNERLQGLNETSLFSMDLDKDILNNNLFGVDINAESVEIARLSLWLVTAEKGKPLTSLKENIRQGNSIVSDRNLDKQAFRWIGRFKEFDVILGNPPYVRQERLTSIKPHLEKTYTTYHGAADLYSYFFELGLTLLKPGGYMSYISSSTFFKTGSGENLRQFLQLNANLKRVVNFGDLQIFKGVTTYPAILVMEKPVRKRKQAPKEYSFQFLNVASKNVSDLAGELQEAAFGTMRQSKLGLEGWRLEDERLLALRSKIIRNKATLKEVYGSPQYGIKTGRNEAFVIDEKTRDKLISEDPKSLKLIKPFLEGKDLKKWHSEPRNIYLIFTRRGVDIEKYPAIKAHLEQYRQILEPKPKDWLGSKWLGRKAGTYKWYEIQDTVDYYNEFDEIKVFYPEFSHQPNFFIDRDSMHSNNKCFFVPKGDPFLLGLLNSATLWFVITGICTFVRGGYYELRTIRMDTLPIPNANDKQKKQVAELAQRCQTTAEKRYLEENGLRRRIPDLCPADHNAKLSKKLQAWWQLEFNEFQKEIKSRFKYTLNLAEKNEWEEALKTGKERIQTLSCELATYEAELNTLVYALFGLNEDEVQLLEQSLK